MGLDALPLIKICRYYFEDDLTQQEIADRMRTSRTNISRLLTLAKKTGVYQVLIRAQASGHADEERKLERRFGLLEAVVIDPGAQEQQSLNRELGKAAAEYLHRTIQEGDTIAVGWGYTLKAMIDSTLREHVKGLKVIQMLGGLTTELTNVHANEQVRDLASRLGAECRIMPIFGVAETARERDILVNSAQIEQIFAMAEKADVAFVSVGVATKDTVFGRAGILSREVLRELVGHGAVGDIMSRFYDKDGTVLESSHNARVTGLTLDRFKRIRRKVGVAGGTQKVPSIRGALQGRYLDVLVTDLKTAENLLGE